MTRGALSYVHSMYPGAFLKSKIFYITVAGTAVTANIKGTKMEAFAQDSYTQVSGLTNSMQVGDGVVPLSNAHLTDAYQLTLPDVYHSINAPLNCWYGGDGIVDYWIPLLEKTYDYHARQSNSLRDIAIGSVSESL